jgi:histidine kinase
MTAYPDVRRSWRFWRRVAIANAAAALLVVAMTGPFRQGASVPRLAQLLALALVYTTPVSLLLGSALPPIMLRLANQPLAYQWMARIAAIVALTAIGCAAAGLIFVAIGVSRPDEYWAQLSSAMGIATLIALAVGASATVIESLRVRLELTTLALRTKELEEERARKLATEAQLAALESRVHPHFLFNTLNTIAALIQDDPVEAERIVQRLAALLRFSLDATANGAAPLAEELRIVRDYLEIECARFGDRLRYAIDIDPSIMDVPIPPLSIQTLVENAVKHGLSTRRDGGQIRVRGHRGEACVVIEVADNGERFAAGPFPPGHGLDTLRGRLRAAGGGATDVALSREGEWTRAVISIAQTA